MSSMRIESLNNDLRSACSGIWPGLVELDKLSNIPNLTDPQKKLVNDLIEQTKKVIEEAPPPER